MSDKNIYYKPVLVRTLCKCPTCKNAFQAQVGDWPFLVGTSRPVCENCETQLVAGQDILAGVETDSIVVCRQRQVTLPREIEHRPGAWGGYVQMHRGDGEDFLQDHTEALVAALNDVARGAVCAMC